MLLILGILVITIMVMDKECSKKENIEISVDEMLAILAK